MGRMDAPPIMLPGWRPFLLAPGNAIETETASGLRVSLSDDSFSLADSDAPFGIASTYRHVCISRRDRYPGWDEMRDFIRSCGYFDRSRDVFMILPPDSAYVNAHPNAFHWWQEVRRRAV